MSKSKELQKKLNLVENTSNIYAPISNESAYYNIKSRVDSTKMSKINNSLKGDYKHYSAFKFH